MSISLETQEIMIAFAIDNKDNRESWGKYDLIELKDAYADMPEDDKVSTTGQRIKDRIDELEKVEVEVEVKNDRPEEAADQSEDDSKVRNKRILIGLILAIIVGVIVAGLI